MQLDEICRMAVDAGVSDILLHEGSPPRFRVSGVIAPLEAPAVGAALFEELAARCGVERSALDADAAFVSDGGERFRVNLFRHSGVRGAALRWVRRSVPSLAELGLPVELIENWVGRRSGIVFVTGPAGSGKSTTLAAAIDYLNQTSALHVVTIENPVEYVFTNERSVFTQREVGIDVESFAAGLRSALRQSPDVIFIGEIRDKPSAETALQASESGHLLLSTVHGSSAAEAVGRFVQIFPSDEQAPIRSVLAVQLVGVLSQRLLPALGGGLALAVEYFTNSGVTRKYIAEGRFGDLADWIRRADTEAAASMLRSAATLCRSGVVDEETAAGAVENPDELRRLLRGISSGAATGGRAA